MSPTLNHSVMVVQPGKMNEAVMFFLGCLQGWTLTNRHPQGNWGEARFVQDEIGGLLQLTMPAEKGPLPSINYAHIGITVQGIMDRMVEKIQAWSNEQQVQVAEIEDEGEDSNRRIFITLSIFAMDIELVPAS